METYESRPALVDQHGRHSYSDLLQLSHALTDRFLLAADFTVKGKVDYEVRDGNLKGFHKPYTATILVGEWVIAGANRLVRIVSRQKSAHCKFTFCDFIREWSLFTAGDGAVQI